jgi:hypothetical protein
VKIWSELHGNVQKAGSRDPGRNTTDSRPNDVELFFDEQMNCYYQLGPKDIWYYHLKTGAIVEIDQNFALTEWYGQVADETMRAIAAGYFPKRFSSDCVYCSYRAQCIGI